MKDIFNDILKLEGKIDDLLSLSRVCVCVRREVMRSGRITVLYRPHCLDCDCVCSAMYFVSFHVPRILR